MRALVLAVYLFLYAPIALVVLFLPNGLISLIVGGQRGKELISNILRKF